MNARGPTPVVTFPHGSEDTALDGRYGGGHLRFDDDTTALAWEPGVGLRPCLCAHYPCKPMTWLHFVQHARRQDHAVFLVHHVPDPCRVWDLFPCGSICGTSRQEANGEWTVWVMSRTRAATLLRLLEISAAARQAMPRVFLTVHADAGSVSSCGTSRGAYVELCFSAWSSYL